MTDLSRTYGAREVAPETRQRLIWSMFDRIAGRYDLMNDLMSMGIHRVWKRVLARQVRACSPAAVMDLAGGTGDVAARVAAAGRLVVVADPSLPMMNAGRAKGVGASAWVGASGEGLPFADATMDAVTIAFGIRNVTHMDRVLGEILRVLRPGGRFFCLEFSRPAAPLRPFYRWYSFVVIPRLGAFVARDPGAYTYLVESIEGFPDQETFKARLMDAGFADVRYRNLSFGIACLHMAAKPGAVG